MKTLLYFISAVLVISSIPTILISLSISLAMVLIGSFGLILNNQLNLT